VALEVSAGVGFASLLFVTGRAAAAAPTLAREILQLACAGGLIALPLVHVPLVAWLRRGARVPAAVVRSLWIAQVLPLFFLRVEGAAQLALGPLALLQGNLLARCDDDRLAAWSAALGPTLVLVGMAAAPAPEWLFLFPLALLACFAALSFLLARSSARRVAEAAPRVLLRDPLAHDAGAAGRAALFARAAYALPLTAGVLLVLPFAYALVMALPGPFERLWSPDRRGAAEAGEVPGASARERSSAARDALARIFPAGLAYGGGGGPLLHEVVMDVVPRAFDTSGELKQAQRPRALYMRGVVIDTFGQGGASLSDDVRPRLVRDRDDGNEDDLTVLAWPRHPAALVLDVLQQPILVREGGRLRTVLFCPEPQLAIALPSVRFDPDGLLTLPGIEQDRFRYRVVTSDLRASTDAPGPARARHPDARFLQVPVDSRELRWIAQRASAVAAGAGTDAERVRAVVEHFQHGYEYSLETRDVPGLQGVVDFLRRREGSCTSYAAAAVLMLRSLGLSARVATGYLAREWIEAEELFRVTTRNGHAWIEVHFEEQGWLTFDPTPADRRDAALRAARAGAEPGLGEWLAALAQDLGLWATSGGHAAYADSFLSNLAGGPRAALGSLSRRPWLAALAPLSLVVAWTLRRRRARSRSALRTRAVRRDPAAGALERLLRGLARRGFRRRPSQTLRELAAEVRQAGGESWAALDGICEALYRARFGGAALTELELEAVGRFVLELRRG